MSLITLFLYLGTPASTTYPSRRRGPPPPLSPGCSSLSSMHLVSILTTIGTSSGQWSLCAPVQTASGSPVLSTTYGAVYQHPPHVDGPACFAVRYAASTLFGPLVYRIYPYIHVPHTNASSYVRLILFTPPRFWPFHVTSVLLLLHCPPTQTHKNTRKPRKHYTSRSPLQSFPAPSHFVVSFTSLPHLCPAGRGAPHPPPPHPLALRTPLYPLDEATPLSFNPLSPPLPVASLRPPVGIRSLYVDIDSLVSPTAHAVLLSACFVHVNRSEAVML